MVLNRLERTLSGFQCSCSPNSPGFRPANFHSLRPRRTKSLPVRNAAILDFTEEAIEPEVELLSKDLLEEKFAGKHGSHISKLQALERLKGDMRSALLDLEEPSPSFSDSDREKLHLARQRHAIEERQAGLDAVKERRKEERAAKRAARKAAASRQLAATASDTASALDERSMVYSKSTVSNRMASRRADKAVARPMKPSARGARAFASSRTRTHAAWGKQLSGKVEEEQIYLKSLGGANSTSFQTRGSDSYGDFLKNMPRHELLTYAEERDLSKRVQDLVLLQGKFKELNKKLGKPPSRREWAEAFGMDEASFNVRWKDGTRARSKMLTCNQRLVVSIALRYQDKGLEVSDLIAEGMTGLARSVEKYDYKKGFKFSTYATWWIRQAISRAIGDLSKTIRLPCHLLEVLGRINKVEAAYKRKYDVFPDVQYVAKKLRISVEKVKMVKQASINPRLLEDPSGADAAEGETYGESLEDNSVTEVQEQLVVDSLHAEVSAVLNKLSARECGILRMRYGLDDGQPKTLEEIGNAFMVTRERIRQIENKAMAKLKAANNHLTLKQFMNGEAMENASDEVAWKANIRRAP